MSNSLTTTTRVNYDVKIVTGHNTSRQVTSCVVNKQWVTGIRYRTCYIICSTHYRSCEHVPSPMTLLTVAAITSSPAVGADARVIITIIIIHARGAIETWIAITRTSTGASNQINHLQSCAVCWIPFHRNRYANSDSLYTVNWAQSIDIILIRYLYM